MIDLNCDKLINGDFSVKSLKYKFYEGELYFLEGINGAGKSTILRYLYNKALNDDDRKRTFYAIDTYCGYEGITIEQTIRIFDWIYYCNGGTFDKQEFNYYWSELSTLKSERVVKTLSSGEKIILMFCLLIACYPKIIIFDETLYPVDKETRKKILNMLKDYVKANDAIFIGTSHNDDIVEYADVILTLKGGKLTNVQATN